MFSNLSNQELQLKKMTLENEYEVIKKKMDDYYQQLHDMEIEYSRIENELKRRTK